MTGIQEVYKRYTQTITNGKSIIYKRSRKNSYRAQAICPFRLTLKNPGF